MRLFEYKCESCGHRFCVSFERDAPPPAVRCPLDGSRSGRRFSFGGLQSAPRSPAPAPPQPVRRGPAGIRMFPGSDPVTVIGSRFDLPPNGAAVVREPGTTAPLTFENNFVYGPVGVDNQGDGASMTIRHNYHDADGGEE